MHNYRLANQRQCPDSGHWYVISMECCLLNRRRLSRALIYGRCETSVFAGCKLSRLFTFEMACLPFRTARYSRWKHECCRSANAAAILGVTVMFCLQVISHPIFNQVEPKFNQFVFGRWAMNLQKIFLSKCLIFKDAVKSVM